MTNFLLILAILAPFVALKLAIYLLEHRLNEGMRQQAGSIHHLAESVSRFGESVGAGLRLFGSGFPLGFTLLHQHQVVAPTATPGSEEDTIPADVMEYLKGWGEQWARDEELRYLRGLKSKLGSWDAALKTVLAQTNNG